VHKRTKGSLVPFVVGAASLVSSCGGGEGAGALVPGGDETAFAPEGIAYELDATAPGVSDLKLVAATIIPTDSGELWLVAVKNEGTQFVCEASMTADLEGASMVQAGSAFAHIVAPMHRVEKLAFAECLPVGAIGMGFGVLRDRPAQTPVLRIKYRLSGILADSATKLSDVTLDNVVIEAPAASDTFVTGTIVNHGTSALQAVTAFLFPVNKVGRPFGIGLDGPPMTFAPGSTWDFKTAVLGPVNRYVTFTQYRQ
jgi:hypothetical protein